MSARRPARLHRHAPPARALALHSLGRATTRGDARGESRVPHSRAAVAPARARTPTRVCRISRELAPRSLVTPPRALSRTLCAGAATRIGGGAARRRALAWKATSEPTPPVAPKTAMEAVGAARRLAAARCALGAVLKPTAEPTIASSAKVRSMAREGRDAIAIKIHLML
jgi:hypothetical protein